MVRTLVGTMLEKSPNDMVDLLQGAPRAAAGSTAPAAGLYLVGVGYD
jgi:tRNA U38,U39,U40 pseudouridine synthase TruA